MYSSLEAKVTPQEVSEDNARIRPYQGFLKIERTFRISFKRNDTLWSIKPSKLTSITLLLKCLGHMLQTLHLITFGLHHLWCMKILSPVLIFLVLLRSFYHGKWWIVTQGKFIISSSQYCGNHSAIDRKVILHHHI